VGAATERPARVGRPPSSLQRFSRTEWLAVLKRSFSRFLQDDCMGLSQQIAYSSLLAFFPAMAFLVGALGLFHLFDDVKALLDPIAPSGVIKFISGLQQDSSGGTSAAAFALGLAGAVWAASGAMGSVLKAVNRAYELRETRPVWKQRGIAILLVFLTGITTAGVFVLIVVGGDLGDAISKKAGLGGAFQLVWTVTFTDGKYTYICDAHPTTMHGSFTVGAFREPVKLSATVGPLRAISLRPKPVTTGSVVLTVNDRSRTDNFHLTGTGVNKRTGIVFRGRVVWKLTLKPGIYTYRSDAHKKLRGSLTVLATG